MGYRQPRVQKSQRMRSNLIVIESNTPYIFERKVKTSLLLIFKFKKGKQNDESKEVFLKRFENLRFMALLIFKVK